MPRIKIGPTALTAAREALRAAIAQLDKLLDEETLDLDDIQQADDDCRSALPLLEPKP
jgi:hypothetical protein